MPKRNLGLLIREAILLRGPISPMDLWRECCRDIKYDTVARYFWILRELGLIFVIAEIPSSKDGAVKKKLYTIVPGRENDPCWSAPQNCLALLRGWVVYDPVTGEPIPITKLGKKRYHKYVKK